MGEVRQLPLLPVRDLVLFPGSEMPIYIGRDASLRAMRQAKAKYGGKIAVFTQLRGEKNGPLTIDDIHQVGTVANIAASVETTDQTIKGMLEGTERVRLQEMTIEDGMMLVTVASEPEFENVLNIEKGEQAALLQLLAIWGLDQSRKDDLPELRTLTNETNIVSVVTALRSLISTPRIDAPGTARGWDSLNNQPSERYCELKNQAVARRQKALEESNFRQKLHLLTHALQFDIECRAETSSDLQK